MDNTKQTMKEKVNSRKLWMFLVLFVIGTIALFTHYADFNGWAEFSKWIFVTYAASNAIVASSRAVASSKDKTPTG